METVWFMIVAFMLVAYVILDGFDIGAGIIHFVIGRTDAERHANIRAIGPVWDGNEVWLLATGGTLYFAFPALYASAFSGFYLPLIIVLWLLIMRAGGIELRHQIDNEMWHTFWDFIFCAASALLAIFFGAALGNVIRGIPIGPDGYFFEALFTHWGTTGETGILDWFTVLSGVVAFVALIVHGAAWQAVKLEGVMNLRARQIIKYAWFVLVMVTVLSLFAVIYVSPHLIDNYYAYPVGWAIPAVVFFSLVAIYFFNARGSDKNTFLASSVYLTAMLGGAVFGIHPNVLPALDPANSLTIYNTKAGSYGLAVGIIWWTIGIIIALGYFVFLFRTFKGKVRVEEH